MSPDLDVLRPEAAQLVSVDGKRYPLESAALTARAEGGFAASTLVQDYANPYDEPLEVLYTLPLPADGAVLGFTITMGERVIRAQVQPREQAERAYRDALYEGRTAGLLEQSRPDTFQQRLGNVPPHTAVRVAIDVLHPLAFRTSGDGAVRPYWEYRFPTVVGVRYDGASGRVSDAAELAPDRGRAASIPTRMSFTLHVADPNPAPLECRSHRVVVTDQPRGAAMEFAADEKLDRDIVARWNACEPEVGARIVEGSGLAGDTGRYALVTLTPPATPRTTCPRDLTVLIDASGSMEGVPLELAKRVSGDLLRSLGAGDRFEVLAFSNDTATLTGGVQEWNGNTLATALAALGSLRASGGTEMTAAIRDALRTLRPGSQRQIVLVTDGYISFEHEVVAEIAAGDNVRLHAVGVGSAPNRALTQQAAAVGRGVEVIVAREADVLDAARLLVAGTARPVLTGIQVSGTALAGEVPSRLRDVFAGQPLVFTAELSGAGGTLELRGHRAGTAEPWTQHIEVPADDAATQLPVSALPLGALHGRACIARIDQEGATGWARGAEDRARRIEWLGMRHQIASSRTSLVAIAEDVSVDPAKPSRRERLAVEVPCAVSAEGAGLIEAPRAAMALRSTLASAAPSRHVVSLMRERRSSPGGYGEPPVGRTRRVPGDLVEVVNARWIGERQLELELRILAHGFELPEGELFIHRMPDGRRVSGVVARPNRAGGAGPFAAGIVVRFVIEFMADVPDASGMNVTMALAGRDVRFTIPPHRPRGA